MREAIILPARPHTPSIRALILLAQCLAALQLRFKPYPPFIFLLVLLVSSSRGCGASAAAKAPPPSQAPTMGPMRPDIAKAFAQFDQDGNGTLEKSELQRAFRAIGFTKVEVRPPMHIAPLRTTPRARVWRLRAACGARVCA